jgi:PRTRC genetic system protein D
MTHSLHETDQGQAIADRERIADGATHFAGINLGRGHVKVKTDNRYFQYASIVQRAQPKLGDLGFMQAATQRVQVAGVAYDVGEEAALVGERSSDKTVFSNWGTSDLYRVLMQSVLDNLAHESGGPWTVMLGLPVAEYKDEAYRKQLAQLWRGQHETDRGPVQVTKVATTPEPLGSFWHYAMERPDLEATLAAQLVVIVDFGYFTTDINAVNRMRLNTAVAGSLNAGMRDVYRIMADLVKTRHRKVCTDVEIEMAVLGKWPLMLRGQPIDLTEPRQLALSHVGERIMQWMQACVDRTEGLVLTTGGGAYAFTDQVAATLPEARVEMVGRPQEANASGYWYMAQTLADVH